MTEPRYTTINDLDHESPQVPRASFATPSAGDRVRSESHASLSPSITSPRLGVFSSAQSYSPLLHDNSGDGIIRSSPSRPFLPSAQSTYSSRPMSRSSSHMLVSDYDSVHQLAGYGDKEAIPMHGYHDKEDRNSMLSHPPSSTNDYRAAGIAKYGLSAEQKKKLSPKKKWGIFFAVVVLLIIIAVAVAVPLLTVHKNVNGASSSDGGHGNGNGNQVPTAGGNGTIIKMANGTSFTYLNNFGGQWRSGLTDDSAQAQYYTPPLNQSWDYSKDRILGVNLGGWLVIEPFIVPSLFEKYENNSQKTYVVDEYTLMQQWIAEGGEALATSNLQQHYDTFITEYDFAQIAAAGLNWVRLPIGYWAITKMPNEPFIEGLAWNYFMKAIQWARKYGLRIELDLHAIPGSQNGYNHGGRLGVFNFLNSPAGLVSAERTLDLIQTITEFITQPSVSNIIPAFGVLNEPNLPVGIGMTAIKSFYAEAYNTVRNTTGLGAGKGPMIFYHDGFMGLNSYTGFMQDADRVGWDLHPYICFVPPFGDRSTLPVAACNGFQANADQGFSQFGVTIAGEFSLATNDCGLFLNGPFQGVRYDGSYSSGTVKSQGSCVPFDDWQNYNASTKQTMHDGAVAQMASFQNFFFWTWKIGDSLRTGGPVNPNWSYSLGLQQGWMPTNPFANLTNACKNLQSTYTGITKTALTWPGTFADWQTGGASTYSPYTASYPYPPASIASSGLSASLTASNLPTYTQTGVHLTANIVAPTASVKSEPVPTYNPWGAGGSYTDGSYAAIAGCNYFPDIWQNVTSIPSGWPCTGTPSQQKRDYSHLFNLDKRQPSPAPTPMPVLRKK